MALPYQALAGVEIYRATYRGKEINDWVGPRALSHIEEFVKGNTTTRFNSRTKDIVAITCGYQGFYGYLRGQQINLELLKAANLV